MLHSIQFGSKEIIFSLSYSDRKSLGITITPEMDVLVKAPVDTALEKILEKVKKRAPWILKQQSFFLTFYPKTPKKKFVSGETHLYLGRQYRLKITVGLKNEVRHRGSYIEIITKQKLRSY